MPTILSGLAARGELKKKLVERLETARKAGAGLALVIVQVGDRPDSDAYIAAKKRFAAEIGVEVRHVHLGEGAPQADVVSEIQRLDGDASVAGIIVQLPLPKAIDQGAVLDAIDPRKDADAIGSESVAKWSAALPGARWPATARGVGELLDFYRIAIAGRKVAVIGRSPLVGAPIAALCRARGAYVTVCHSKTADLRKETLASDVIISAAGRPRLLTAEHVRQGQVLVDVGISRADGPSAPRLRGQESGKLAGDADFAAASAVIGDAGAISPVPGGVGPMTVLALFENLADCATMQALIK